MRHHGEMLYDEAIILIAANVRENVEVRDPEEFYFFFFKSDKANTFARPPNTFSILLA